MWYSSILEGEISTKQQEMMYVAMPCEIHLTAQVFSYIVKTTRMVCDCFRGRRR